MLRILLDENFNQRILRGLLRKMPNLDYVIAQEVELGGLDDERVLNWAAMEKRIVLTHDVNTIPKFGYVRIEDEKSMPGIFVIPDLLPIGQAIEELYVNIECSESDDWNNQIIHLPL